MQRNEEVFTHISPADFFYRNRDLAGFSNPTRALYSTIRELVENSLDACELYGIPPDIFVRLSQVDDAEGTVQTFKIRIEDNGSGIPAKYVPSAFGRILFGSKYTLRQVRGTFGLGGKMAILYGQIMTNGSAQIISSTGDGNIYDFQLMIDIEKNEPIELRERISKRNRQKWHGTIVEYTFEGDYVRAMSKVIEYLKQTAMVAPYANLTFIDPKGRLYRFQRVIDKMPKPPEETEPHPYGVDVELFQRLVKRTNSRDMIHFLSNNFHRVGKKTAENFIKFSKVKKSTNPKKLSQEEIVSLVHALKEFEDFLPPDATSLSPLGEELLEIGIKKELNPEFVSVIQMPPSAYSGYPFIVEIGIACGGDIPRNDKISIFRFANRIPLLYDESSDVIWKVINERVNWKRYKVSPGMPIVVVVHICSTKIPYKTVGKEFIADRPEVEKMILSGVRRVARRLKSFLSRKINVERERRRLDVFRRYLPKISRFSTELARKRKEPDIEVLIKSISRYDKNA